MGLRRWLEIVTQSWQRREGSTLMVELLVMRHAKSAWDTDAASDFDRPLAKRGERDRTTMTDWLAHQELVPDLIVSSSALRTRMTVAPIIERFDTAAAFDSSLYGASAGAWFAGLRAQAEQLPHRVLICGHNPGLDELVASVCLEPPPRTASGKLMTTAAIAHLELPSGWATAGHDAARLVQLVRPRELITGDAGSL